jgi:hypothetical protein
MTAIQLPLFTEAEAREHTERTRESLVRSWQLVVEGYERGVHVALSFASWREYAIAELGYSQTRAYAMLDHGRVMQALESVSRIRETPNAGQAAELAPVLRKNGPEAVADVWAETVERTDGKPTAAAVRDVVEQRTREPEPPPEPEPVIELEPVESEPGPELADPPVEPVYSGQIGDNADLIAAASTLYIRDGATVADVTYGKGAFWRKTDTQRFELRASDLHPLDDTVTAHDFRDLPYHDETLDVVVLDPPYVHNPGRHITDARYNNAATTTGMYNADIMRLYGQGMEEARRVLRGGGQLWVKCKDEVESGKQRWSHITLFRQAEELGFYARDLFVIIPWSRTTSNRWPRQFHARKNHSYLWVFERQDGGT